MSNRVFDVLKQRCGEKREGWFSIEALRVGSPHTMAKRFREARVKAGYPKILSSIVGGMITAPGF